MDQQGKSDVEKALGADAASARHAADQPASMKTDPKPKTPAPDPTAVTPPDGKTPPA